jgi:hypothetical protein
VQSNLTELVVLRFLLLFFWVGSWFLLVFLFFFFVVAREQCFVRVLVQMRPPDVVDERILVCDIFECYSA